MKIEVGGETLCSFGGFCGSPIHRVVGGRPLCQKHVRFLQIKSLCSHRKIATPTSDDLQRLVDELDDMKCPHCSARMNWMAADGLKTTVTLQHHRNGAIGLLCFSCNSADGATKGGAFLETPPGHKQCPGCLQMLSLGMFSTDRSRRLGKATYCTACATRKAREYYQRNPVACAERQRRKRANRKVKITFTEGDGLPREGE